MGEDLLEEEKKDAKKVVKAAVSKNGLALKHASEELRVTLEAEARIKEVEEKAELAIKEAKTAREQAEKEKAEAKTAREQAEKEKSEAEERAKEADAARKKSR